MNQDLFYSKLNRAELADILFRMKVRQLDQAQASDEAYAESFFEICSLERTGRLALVKAIEAAQ